jgi:hypothetical protein
VKQAEAFCLGLGDEELYALSVLRLAGRVSSGAVAFAVMKEGKGKVARGLSA